MSIAIDPDIKGYINAAVAVCGVVATLGVSILPDYVPSPVAKDIVQTAGLIFAVYGALNSAGNFLSSSKPGALAPPDPPVVKAATALATLPPDATLGQVELAKVRVKTAVEVHNP